MKARQNNVTENKGQSQLRWAIEEYKARLKEAKAAKFHDEVKGLKKKWENREKIAGIHKKEAELLLDRAARQLARGVE